MAANAGQPVGVEEVRRLGAALLDEVERAVVGKREVLELVLVGLLADGHVLLEDVPGVAKTLIARSFAATCALRFGRVQFTPDLVPADITGSLVPDRRSGEVTFQPGPLFANLVLGDEVNRAPPKTQAALLEAMEERQVTADGVSYRLERPFLVLATQNPLESEGTYPLPEAQLDRFLLRVAIGYPSADAEVDLLRRRVARRADPVALRPLLDGPQLVALQEAVELVQAADDVLAYVVALVEATRRADQTEAGASPRGSLALLRAARARAALDGRDFTTPDDVKGLAVPALAHRLVLRPEAWVRGVSGADVVRQCLAAVPTPAALTADDLARLRGPAA